MGDEDKLRLELLDASRGDEPRSPFWKKAQGTDAYFSGAGSQNIWLMRFAMQALMGRIVPWEHVYAYQLGCKPGDTLVARGTAVTLTSAVQPDDRVYVPSFGGSEFMSTIYWPWHVMSHVALMRAKQPEIAALARRWVVLNWVLFRAITAPDGSLMLFGQRSAGHAPFPREMDWIYALASGGDLRRAEKWCKIMGAGLKSSWEKEIALELAPEMRETWEESLALPLEVLQSLLLRVPTEIVRTTEGIAVVHGGNCNPNTPPILAGTCDVHGRRMICPTSIDDKGKPVPGGVRIRQKFDHASARIEGSEIVYQSSLYTGDAEIRIPMPAGEVLYHLRLGSAVAPVEPPADVTPIEPVPVAPADFSRAIELLAGLQLSKKHAAIRGTIIAGLREGPSAEALAGFASQVEMFGIGQKQAQYSRWREAIDILKGAAA